MLDPMQLAPETVRPIARAEYDRMVSLGLFEDDERIELLYGVLVRMPPQDPAHSVVVQILTNRLVLALASRATVRAQLPFAASDDSEPEPDIAVVPNGARERRISSSKWRTRPSARIAC
ncbi:MAG: Uma2 family endonuclease [Labilithrix sp.]|nr:Uma2 family endonuclease [Labilithrix sp.]